MPASLCTILLFDPETGAATALLEATGLTALRTGGGIGAATRALARSDAKTAAMIGAGGMAYCAVEAVITACPNIARVIIWNRSAERGRTLMQKLTTDFGNRCEFVLEERLETAVRTAEIITACTSSIRPLVQGAWLRPGTHVNLAGAHGDTMREGDDTLINRATLVAVDKIDAACVSGEIAIPLESGLLAMADLKEIGSVIAGQSSGRESDEDITVFKSVGIAAQDLMTAGVVVERARQRKKGTHINLHEGLELR